MITYYQIYAKYRLCIDPSLKDVVGRVLPLAAHYVTIQSFVDSRSKFEYGLVNHALCAAIREMLKVSRLVA
jgi:gamma-tubulin complex component 2